MDRPIQGPGKKLIDAARYYAGDRKPAVAVDAGVIEQLERFKAPQAVIDRARERMRSADADDFEVWPDNWQAVSFFCRLETQWRYVGSMASVHRVGLEYGGVEAAMRLTGIARGMRAALFDDICLMETAALAVWNAKK